MSVQGWLLLVEEHETIADNLVQYYATVCLVCYKLHLGHGNGSILIFLVQLGKIMARLDAVIEELTILHYS